MNCPRCEFENSPIALFCSTCGLKLSELPSHQALSFALEGKPASGKKKKGIEGPGFIFFGRYEIKEELATGGMGKLFLARDIKMNCPVVIKEMIQTGISDKKMEYLQKRFMEEARILFRLKHHSLPRVVDYFNVDNLYYIIMEYVEGEDLSKKMEKAAGSLIDINEILYLLNKILDILIYLHSQSPPVIHRDIKPQNIMITSQGEVLLVDFGLARSLEEGQKGTARVGTHGFASPEHHTGEFSVSSDLYSLGAAFHYIITGESPRERLPFIFPPLSNYRNDIPDGLQAIFDRLLETSRDRRYKTAITVKEDLETLLSRGIKKIHRRVGLKPLPKPAAKKSESTQKNNDKNSNLDNTQLEIDEDEMNTILE